MSLPDELDNLDTQSDNGRIYDTVSSVLQSVSSIRKRHTSRVLTKDDSRGVRLHKLEQAIATLDFDQNRAVIETVDGVQRIRGLAGSGKTIVLALKAAYLHAQHPQWKIAVTFYTRSLKEQFRYLINKFCIEQTGDEPDWDRVKILHAWGSVRGGEQDGIYSEFCRVHDVECHSLSSAKRGGDSGNPFSWACEQALSEATDHRQEYDVILVDEAQDLPSSFLKLCYRFLNDRRRLVYAYDELQSLSGESMSPPDEIFGTDEYGGSLVSFKEQHIVSPKNDIILPKCYRNSRPVLVTAHALGFGIYRDRPEGESTGLVQMFDEPHLWEEVGYRITAGKLEDGSDVTLMRSPETSPQFLESHSPEDDLVQFHRFNSEREQAEWVARQIQTDLNEQELEYRDIMVINPDPKTTKDKTSLIRQLLFKDDISSHLAGYDNPDEFFDVGEESVTFTGINRAKGNEAGMVYIINAQACQASKVNLATLRNRLFTAITRSKAWVRICGVGDDMDSLIEEFKRLKRNGFALKFRYPTSDERTKLRMIHRDRPPDEVHQIDRREREVRGLIEDLKAERIDLSDLDPAIIGELIKLIKEDKA